ncbi:hypothetical protein DPMN_017072 [Dreissena polymorpha]|uniref:Uncharacterized protein n=1 Tax=Dreissena polymorpha TaxID=45954 RepID=A0A9D4S623_DREPO|nr:hypothetical protein DPMN_017072 [Dreissena polymorpha]
MFHYKFYPGAIYLSTFTQQFTGCYVFGVIPDPEVSVTILNPLARWSHSPSRQTILEVFGIRNFPNIRFQESWDCRSMSNRTSFGLAGRNLLDCLAMGRLGCCGIHAHASVGGDSGQDGQTAEITT